MYKLLLELYTIEDYPINYASTQNDLGNTNVSLFTFYDRTLRMNRSFSNSRQFDNVFYINAAIQNFHEALKIRKRNVYPLDYAYYPE